MPALSEYTNVNNTALNILVKKGFQVWIDDKNMMYCAEKSGWDFMADTPCGLLGVVAIFEDAKPIEYKEYWWRIDSPDITSTLPRKPKKYRSVCE